MEGGVVFNLGSHLFGNYTLKMAVARMRLMAATLKIMANSHMYSISNLFSPSVTGAADDTSSRSIISEGQQGILLTRVVMMCLLFDKNASYQNLFRK